MLFPTVDFAIFFPIVLALSWALMKRPVLWKPLIIVASYVFYGAADPIFCLLLAGVTVVNQAAALLMARTGEEGRRKLIVGAAVAIDLAVLATFKYYTFFVDEVGDTLDAIGLGLPLPLLTIALPIGISFYTFQAITYVVDVKRGDAEAASHLDAALYLSFFPQLVAGPIVRASEFLPQLKAPRDPAKVAAGAGMALIALGLVKKVLIADSLARDLVDPVFAVPQAYQSLDLALAGYGWAVQVYCDFSGYTDIAIGVALLMGFNFPQNFDRPFRSLGFREFWRRWHMTLARFLRDYLYIPLGGNRKGQLRTNFNLFVTMTLGGLWHGANWPSVLWGAYNGVGLVGEHRLGSRIDRIPTVVRWFIAFHLILFGLVLFRSHSIPLFGEYLAGLTDIGGPTVWTLPMVAAIIAVIGAQLVPTRWIDGAQQWIETRHPLVLAPGLAAVVIIVGATVPTQGVPPFVYFQF